MNTVDGKKKTIQNINFDRRSYLIAELQLFHHLV